MPNSYNGWPVSTNPPLDNSVIPGTNGAKFAPGVLAGDVADVLFFVGAWINAKISPLTPGWCWGYSYRQNVNANNWSCHASATAADVDAPAHPNGKRGTWGAAAGRIRAELLAYLEGVVQWGEDYVGTPDGMHFEIIKGWVDVARVAAKIRRDHGPRESWAEALGGQPPPQATPQPTPAPAPGPQYSAQAKIDQANLRDTGFDPGTPDGYWGAKSAEACKRFQFAARIAVDGICGPTTRAMLTKVPSWRGAPDQPGDGGYSALRWQQELKRHGWRIETDGIWGAHSKSILQQFQADKRITADGIRGPQSWTTLFCTVN